ncbi:MAG: EamA family transporter [Thermodesulfobacteriota bacterium]|nr:EamA family transporter [Thermodesulfobacteriota bacterium]
MLIVIIALLSLEFKPDILPKGVLLAIKTGILGFAGVLCFLYAASKGPISLIAILSALYPIIAIVLAMIFLNESISIKQGMGDFSGVVCYDINYQIKNHLGLSNFH